MNITGFTAKVLLDMVGHSSQQPNSTKTISQELQTPLPSTAHAQTPASSLQLTDSMNTTLNDLLGTLSEHQELLQSLPQEVRDIVQQTMNDLTPQQGNIQNGLATLVKTPKLITAALLDLARQLETGDAVLPKEPLDLLAPLPAAIQQGITSEPITAEPLPPAEQPDTGPLPPQPGEPAPPQASPLPDTRPQPTLLSSNVPAVAPKPIIKDPSVLPAEQANPGSLLPQSGPVPQDSPSVAKQPQSQAASAGGAQETTLKPLAEKLLQLAQMFAAGPPPDDAPVQLNRPLSLPPMVLQESADIIKTLAAAIVSEAPQELQQQLLQALPPEVQEVIRPLLKEFQAPQHQSPDQLPDSSAPADHLLPDNPPAAKFPDRMAERSVPERLAEGNEKSAKMITALNSLPATVLKQSTATLRKMAAALNKYESLSGSTTPKGDTIATLSIPVYFEQGKAPYPAYLHIYHQKEGTAGSTPEAKPETWLRFCLGTENLGNVNVLFHLYGDRQLDVKVNFETDFAAHLFNGYVPAIQDKLSDSPLNVTSIIVDGQT